MTKQGRNKSINGIPAHPINILLPDATLELFKKEADALGLGLAPYVRMIILKSVIDRKKNK